MKKMIIGVILAHIAVLVSIPLIRANMTWNRPIETYYDTTVILDAGHGGKDGGASSREGLIERDLVFKITTMVKEHLHLQGFNVIMTRVDENDLASQHATNRKREDLARRIEILNTTENAIAVSIHANAINDVRWQGAQVFYDASSLENKELATHIMASLRANIEGLDREQKPISNIFILRNSEIPTALVEVGFLSNLNEAALLEDEEYQHFIAYAIFEGILAYVESTELSNPTLEKNIK